MYHLLFRINIPASILWDHLVSQSPNKNCEINGFKRFGNKTHNSSAKRSLFEISGLRVISNHSLLRWDESEFKWFIGARGSFLWTLRLHFNVRKRRGKWWWQISNGVDRSPPTRSLLEESLDYVAFFRLSKMIRTVLVSSFLLSLTLWIFRDKTLGVI